MDTLIKQRKSQQTFQYALSIVFHGCGFNDEATSEIKDDDATTGAVSSEAIVSHLPCKTTMVHFSSTHY